MKAFWISALLLASCAGAVTSISKVLVYGAAQGASDRLAVIRSTADPYVLADSVRRGFAAADASRSPLKD